MLCLLQLPVFQGLELSHYQSQGRVCNGTVPTHDSVAVFLCLVVPVLLIATERVSCLIPML